MEIQGPQKCFKSEKFRGIRIFDISIYINQKSWSCANMQSLSHYSVVSSDGENLVYNCGIEE